MALQCPGGQRGFGGMLTFLLWPLHGVHLCGGWSGTMGGAMGVMGGDGPTAQATIQYTAVH